MTKLYVLSDTHCEFFDNEKDIKYTLSEDVDAVVMAGDIHRGDYVAQYLLGKFVDYPNVPIIYIAGNHEHYKTGKSIQKMHDLMRQQAKDAREAGRQLYFLENEEIVLTLRNESVRFIGCTLWTDMELLGKSKDAEAYAERNMNDFYYSLVDDDGGAVRGLKAKDTIQMHNQSVRFLKKHLNNRAKKHVFDKTVVITHHLPSEKSISPIYIADRLNIAFASKLDDLLKTGSADLWIHGHTHKMCEYIVDGKTWVVCNPHGYPGENNHVKGLEIEI